MPRELLQAIVDTAMEGVIVVDADGDVIIFNPASEQIFGYAASEMLGRPVTLLLPWPSIEEHRADIDSFRHTGGRRLIGINRELEARRKDASTFPLEVSVSVVAHNDRQVFVAVFRDITERKHDQEVRDLLMEKLTASNQELGHFAQAASHDLQQGVRMVSSFCTLLSQQYGDRLDERGKQYLVLAVDAATQMGNLLEDLMHYGRLGLETVLPSRFNAATCLRQAVNNLNDSIQETSAQITIDPMPEIQGNQIRFTRLVQNLLGNALKYVPAGVAPVIHVSAIDEQAVWRFSVADNGIGIDPQYHSRIFEPFKRLHSQSEYRGTGLGLAICKRIVEGFGGRVWAERSPSGGAVFNFTIEKTQQEN